MPAILLILLLTSLAGVAADSGRGAPGPASNLYINSGTLMSASGGAIQVRSFLAAIQDEDSPSKSCDHEQKQKAVSIIRGEAFISNESLDRLLNDKLRDRKVEDIHISYDKGRAKITGTAKKTISMPFTIEGPVSLSQQGFILLKAEKMKVGKLPGLAELLGVDPEKLAGDGKVKGVQASKDSISFDPDLLWGLPVHGKPTRVAYLQNGLQLVFGSSKPARTRNPKLARKAQ